MGSFAPPCPPCSALQNQPEQADHISPECQQKAESPRTAGGDAKGRIRRRLRKSMSENRRSLLLIQLRMQGDLPFENGQSQCGFVQSVPGGRIVGAARDQFTPDI